VMKCRSNHASVFLGLVLVGIMGLASADVKLSKHELRGIADHWNHQLSLPKGLVAAVLQVESNWNPQAIGRAGEIGLGQIKPTTVISLVGHDPYAKQRTIYTVGSVGDPVSRIQAALARNGYALAIDGVFGVVTLGAVMDYQQKHSLTVDGLVGPNTWASLFPRDPFPGKTVRDALFDPSENIYWTAYILKWCADELGEDTTTVTMVLCYNGGLGNGMLHHVRKVKAAMRKQ
jgi:soluble lytic murein transglycosylase-like protein